MSNNIVIQRNDGSIGVIDTGDTPGAIAYQNMWPFTAPGLSIVAYDQVVPNNDNGSLCDWTGSALVINPAKFMAYYGPQISSMVSQLLNDLAVAWGYDSKESLAGYALSTVTKFKNEATTFIAWRDAVWSQVITDQNAIIAGTEPFPSDVNSYIATLPVAPTKP